MLLYKAELSWDKPVKSLPVRCVLLPVLLAETEKQVPREDFVHRISFGFVGDSSSYGNHLSGRSINACYPLALITHLTHMSGLLGLFVWKQKSYHGCAGHPIHPQHQIAGTKKPPGKGGFSYSTYS